MTTHAPTTPTRSASDGAQRLYPDAAGRLTYTDHRGALHTDITPIRTFPISDPDCHIALLDNRGREVGTLDDLADLPAETANLVRQKLDEREFLPKIQRIITVRMNKDPHEWEVVTDRGPVNFLMRDEDIRRLGPTRAILVDLHGVRYYIPDSRQLDPKSRRYLTQYL
jgi:hypothetical protein